MSSSGWKDARQYSLVEALSTDHRAAAVSSADIALLDYALALTRAPASVTSLDVERLRTEGFDDRAIHDACAIVAYFAFANRVADGLGVELEEEGAEGR